MMSSLVDLGNPDVSKNVSCPAACKGSGMKEMREATTMDKLVTESWMLLAPPAEG